MYSFTVFVFFLFNNPFHPFPKPTLSNSGSWGAGGHPSCCWGQGTPWTGLFNHLPVKFSLNMPTNQKAEQNHQKTQNKPN